MLDFLAEKRIAEAVSRGELDAGFIPPEVEHLNEISQLERYVGDEEGRSRAARKLALLRTRIEDGYYGKVLNRLGRAR